MGKTSVADEMKDQNSFRAKAHKATMDAVSLAEKEPTMAKVTPKAEEAKGLYAKMVEEKVKLARARYAAKNSKKDSGKLIQKLLEEAKKARDKELGEMKKVKAASVKVAADGAKINQQETKIAREERDGSKAQ